MYFTCMYIILFLFSLLAAGISGFPKDVTCAKATLLFNLCSVFCLKKEYEQAKKSLNQVGVALTD